MKCKKCQAEIPEDSLFCEKCGHKVEVKSENVLDQDEPETYKKAIDHLEFLGYEIKGKNFDNNWFSFLAISTSKSNIYIRYNQSIGFTFAVTYNFNQKKIEKKRSEFLELINKRNNSSLISCFALSDDSSKVMTYTWFTNDYKKQNFANVIELFEMDINNMLRDPNILEFS